MSDDPHISKGNRKTSRVKKNKVQDVVACINTGQEYNTNEGVKDTLIQLIKLFDEYFILYVAMRQYRDSRLLNYVMQYIYNTLKSSDSAKISLDLSNNILSKNNIDISVNNIFNDQKNIQEIEIILSKIKAIFIFFELFCTNNNITDHILINNIQGKILKINQMTDRTFLSQVTKNEKIINDILKKAKECTNYKDIKIDRSIYSNLINVAT